MHDVVKDIQPGHLSQPHQVSFERTEKTLHAEMKVHEKATVEMVVSEAAMIAIHLVPC